MHAAPGRRGGRADVEAFAGAVGIGCEARANERLDGGVGAADDVAADVVRIRGLEIGRRASGAADDPLPQAGCKALDLGDDDVGGVAAIGVRYVRVGPDRVDVPGRAARVREVLLCDQHEGALGQPAPVRLALRRNYLLEAPAGVNGPGAATGLARPRHPALDGEVNLEGGGPEAVAPIGA